MDQLPSYDPRCADAAGDIWQHRENNLDWEDDWVFTDDRFELAHNYLVAQITRMETAIENDPELAIGTAKELVENRL